MNYTEEDLRNAFQAGRLKGSTENDGYYSDIHLSEDEYIDSLKPKSNDEDLIPVTAKFLIEKLGWEGFCDATGIDYYAKRNGFEIDDNEIFKVNKNLIL